MGAAFGSDSCTGFDEPSVALSMTATDECTDADKDKWNSDAGHATWQSDMTTCGSQCLGIESCVTSCMETKGWSNGCAGCFGSLAQCTASNCMTKCIGGRTDACVSCLEAAGCDKAAFGSDSCTGFDVPRVVRRLTSMEIIV